MNFRPCGSYLSQGFPENRISNTSCWLDTCQSCRISLCIWIENVSGATLPRSSNTPLLDVHLLKRVCYIKRRDLFSVLEFEELISAVASHVYEDVAALVCIESFRDGCIRADAT